MSGAYFRGGNEDLYPSVDVLHKTSNLPVSRCSFADDGKEMDKNEKRTCRACKAIVFWPLKVMLHEPIFNADF